MCVVAILSISIGIKEYDIMQIPSRTLKLKRALVYYTNIISVSASLKNFYWADDDIVYANIQLSSNENEEIKKLEKKLLDIGFSENKPSDPLNYFKVGVFSPDGTEKYFFINKRRISAPDFSDEYLVYNMSFDGVSCRASERILSKSNLLIEINPVYNNIRIQLKKKLDESKREEWLSKFASSLQLSLSPKSERFYGAESGIYDMHEMKTVSEKRIADTKERIRKEEETERSIEKFKGFYSGSWSGTYTVDGDKSSELSIDLLRTYTKASQEPHLRGILRLGYGAIAKVNLKGNLSENGETLLTDSNHITWEASPYYDGSKRIAGTFKGRMNGKDFKGKWLAEKKGEQKHFESLSPEEERKTIDVLILGEWLSDWYGNIPSCPTKFDMDGNFYVQNPNKRFGVEKGTWKIVDRSTFELKLSRESIVYKVNTINVNSFEFQAKDKKWQPWKGKRKN